MEVLTAERAKPALPFAGVYRLLDFSLSNLHHSAIDDVWLVVQFETQSILKTTANGRPWDLDRTYGGLRLVPPQQEGETADGEDGWHRGNADAIYNLRQPIRDFGPDVVLVLSADHVYKLEYSAVVDQHVATGAACTLVTTEVPRAQAPNHGTVSVGRDGKVTGFEYKAEQPASTLAVAEVFVYDTDALLGTLDRIVARSAPDEDAPLEDFGHQLLPELVAAGNVHEFRLDGYWKDVGRPETYFAAHMEVLRTSSNRSSVRRRRELELDDPEWPILTRDSQRMPARLHGSAAVDHSLVSPGCDVAGKVERSVLGPGVVVEAGALVRDAIVFNDTVIRSGATVEFAIVDSDVVVGRDARVGAAPKAKRPPTTEELTLVGARVNVNAEATVAAGARVEPGAHVRR